MDVPPAAFEVTESWTPDLGRKELMIQPTRPAAATIWINYEVGHPEFNTTVGRTSLELDAPEGGDLLGEIIEGVAVNGFDEAGFMDYFGRVRLLNGVAAWPSVTSTFPCRGGHAHSGAAIRPTCEFPQPPPAAHTQCSSKRSSIGAGTAEWSQRTFRSSPRRRRCAWGT